MSKMDLPSVSSIYRDKHVLLIGSTGFLGKLLVEKLLREAPDIGQITLLIRASHRRGQARTAAQRVDGEILNTPLFEHLRDTVGDNRFNELAAKLAAVTGDVTLPDLGMASAQYQALAQSTDIIINSAASVNFREALDQALDTNTFALDRLMDFAAQRTIPLLHISTCYVNSFNSGLISEASHGPEGATLANSDTPQLPLHQHFATDEIIDDLQHAISQEALRHPDNARARHEAMVALGQRKAAEYGWNDCYTMTKWLAEQRLIGRRPEGGLTILRPSIIESTCMAPIAGWLEGIKVADAIIYAFAKRGLSMFPGHKNRVIDIIPADIVANSVLLSGAELIAGQREVRIYHCSSGSSNPLTVAQLRDHVVGVAQQQHSDFPRLFASRPTHGLSIVPPLVFEGVAACMKALLQFAARLSPRSEKAKARLAGFGKMRDLVSLYAFYASPQYVFCNRRLQRLHSAFPNADRLSLPVDVAGMDWQNYFAKVHIPGLHRYALKPRNRSTVPPIPEKFAAQAMNKPSAAEAA